MNGSGFQLPQDDLEPLKQIVGKAKIVALGESVHTSGGYYEMKHRLFRFLVEKMGFRAFAFETPWDDADRLAHYVDTCEGTSKEAMRGIFGVWQSTETQDLMEWMCEWNKSHKKAKDKLHFFGFDVQQPEKDGPALLAFLERLDIGYGDPRVEDVRMCDGVASSPTYDGSRLSETSHQVCLRGLAAVQALFDNEGPATADRTSPVDLEYAWLRLVGLRSWQGEAYYGGLNDYPRQTESRDSGMAYAFRTLRRLRHGEIKTAVWAHNFHIAKDALSSSWGTTTMGTYLREDFGASYAAIALISDVTEIDWRGLGCGRTTVLRTDRTVEKLLGDLGYDYLLVDLDFPGGNPPFLAAGENYRLSEVGMMPVGQYDAAVFLEHSHKMTPLRWAPCTP